MSVYTDVGTIYPMCISCYMLGIIQMLSVLSNGAVTFRFNCPSRAGSPGAAGSLLFCSSADHLMPIASAILCYSRASAPPTR